MTIPERVGHIPENDNFVIVEMRVENEIKPIPSTNPHRQNAETGWLKVSYKIVGLGKQLKMSREFVDDAMWTRRPSEELCVMGDMEILLLAYYPAENAYLAQILTSKREGEFWLESAPQEPTGNEGA